MIQVRAKEPQHGGQKNLVPKKGLEPSHPCEYMDLNHARLPIPPLRLTAAERLGVNCVKSYSFKPFVCCQFRCPSCHFTRITRKLSTSRWDHASEVRKPREEPFRRP